MAVHYFGVRRLIKSVGRRGRWARVAVIHMWRAAPDQIRGRRGRWARVAVLYIWREAPDQFRCASWTLGPCGRALQLASGA